MAERRREGVGVGGGSRQTCKRDRGAGQRVTGYASDLREHGQRWYVRSVGGQAGDRGRDRLGNSPCTPPSACSADLAPLLPLPILLRGSRYRPTDALDERDVASLMEIRTEPY